MLNPAVLMILFRSVPVFQAAWQRWRFRCGDQVFAALHNLLHGMSLLVAVRPARKVGFKALPVGSLEHRRIHRIGWCRSA
jgi:hypothetical protein